MNRVKDGKTVTSNNTSEGLVLRGSVLGRSKRLVGEKKMELVTYKIFAGTNVFFVKDWMPNDYYTVGEIVELPIFIKSYQKDGRIMTDFTISNSRASGEEF